MIEDLYRYPLKGFPAQRLEVVDLKVGQGIAGDRALALGFNSQHVEPAGGWTPCQAFQRMSIRPDLTRYQLDVLDETLRLTSPQLLVEHIDEDSKCLVNLATNFGEKTPVHRRKEGGGYWDHPDAALSIINIATIEEIAKTLKRPIAPLQFRANIYVRAEPWAEFHWLGQSLEIGDARIDIIRPIDRCKTTSVNVDTGELDVNMPAALQQHFGHMFCGVYASVRNTGRIGTPAIAQITPSAGQSAVRKAASVSTAPSLPHWPRPATICETRHEAEDIKSIWIEDSLSDIGALSDFKAGQYIRIHGLGGERIWRSYTVSPVQEGKLRVTVKRDIGVGSQAMHNLVAGDMVTLTGPFGEATLRDPCKAIHFVSAGIGITPIIAKLSALAVLKYAGPIVVHHVARDPEKLALWDEIEQAAAALPNIELHLYLTQNTGDRRTAHHGRPNCHAVIEQANIAQADIHICGPNGFVRSLDDHIEAANIPRERVFRDSFCSSSVTVNMREIAPSPPIKVTLSRSNITDYWRPQDGTLLEFAEKRGVITPSHCRAGICNTCQCNVIAGATERLVGEEGEDRVRTLLCTSIPTETLTLDI
ncbi:MULTISPECIES: MOSC domain-containing protein [Falsihalocynthiibacter]|uniref:MOSC domain-containing protein n=1 Tax=Falsihalocynthiibacter TaxID=2854182 RepID=UPI003002B4DC